jgi:RimJ/RimL family protein N-acetyltransferase/8-oxo-dGTP pyrophosphatase MutT (NUDIX family)
VETTWDGLSITKDEPIGATVVVRRPGGDVLLLHRAVNGADHAGDWAWTSPAGCRFPGEAILPGALRELAEEAGLSGVAITPVDLSGRWGLFTAEVGAETEVTLVDVEHDRFEWVPATEAYPRCTPDHVGRAMRRAVATPIHDIGFRPLRRDDLPSMVTWQNAPHAAEWWSDGVGDITAAETKYGPRIDGRARTAVDIILLGGRPIGFIQTTPLAADPDYLDVAAPVTDGGRDAVAIDYTIGEPELIGRGIGTQAIWGYLTEVVFRRFPSCRFVVTDPETVNMASIRACEKSGFRIEARFTDDGIAHTLCVLDRQRVFGDVPPEDPQVVPAPTER